MPRYFFNIHNDVETPDEEGTELPDLKAAIDFAVAGARSLAAETVAEGRLVGHHRIEIIDGDGKLVGSVRFDEAVEIQP